MVANEEQVGVRSYHTFQTKAMSKFYAKLDKAIGDFHID